MSRACHRIGCLNSLDHLRSDAVYCGETCKREAARSRAFSAGTDASGAFWSAYAGVRRRRRGAGRERTA